MIGLRRAVEEIPRSQLPFLVLDDQNAASREHEEPFLAVLAVVTAQAFAGLEDADVDAELGKWPLALEVAVAAEPVPLPPASFARVDDEPAFFIRDQPELRLPERAPQASM